MSQSLYPELTVCCLAFDAYSRPTPIQPPGNSPPTWMLSITQPLTTLFNPRLTPCQPLESFSRWNGLPDTSDSRQFYLGRTDSMKRRPASVMTDKQSVRNECPSTRGIARVAKKAKIATKQP